MVRARLDVEDGEILCEERDGEEGEIAEGPRRERSRFRVLQLLSAMYVHGGRAEIFMISQGFMGNLGRILSTPQFMCEPTLESSVPVTPGPRRWRPSLAGHLQPEQA